MFTFNRSNNSTWDRAVELLKDHCAEMGAGNLRVEPRRGGGATIHLSLELSRSFQPFRRSYKPPGRRRRDQLRKEDYLSRKVPPAVVSGAPVTPGAGLPQPPGGQMTADPTPPHRPTVPVDTGDTGGEEEETNLQEERNQEENLLEDLNQEESLLEDGCIRTPGGTSLAVLRNVAAGEGKGIYEGTPSTPGTRPGDLLDTNMDTDLTPDDEEMVLIDITNLLPLSTMLKCNCCYKCPTIDFFYNRLLLNV